MRCIDADTKKFCIHSDGLGYCDILSDDETRQYCVESPCPHEKLVEYEPVRYGHWERTADGAAWCSACKRKMNPSQYGYAFCGLCGARMDGEK